MLLKKIQSKMKALEWPHDHMSFSRRSREANSVVSGQIWREIDLIQALMHVLVTCKNEEDPLK